MQNAAPYLLSTKVAIKLHERAPRSPDRNRYDLLRYPKRGIESLQLGEKRFQAIRRQDRMEDFKLQ